MGLGTYKKFAHERIIFRILRTAFPTYTLIVLMMDVNLTLIGVFFALMD